MWQFEFGNMWYSYIRNVWKILGGYTEQIWVRITAVATRNQLKVNNK